MLDLIAINIIHHRTGSLFENKFERKLITSEKYFKQLIFYIHNNPVHHGFVTQIGLYPWSSYNTILSEQPTQLKREEVMNLYGDKESFISYHCEQHNTNEIIDFIIDF